MNVPSVSLHLNIFDHFYSQLSAHEGVSHGSLLLAQRQPHTLLAAGGGGHAHCVLVTRLLQTGSQGIVYTR